MSKHIAELETALGVTLVNRKRRDGTLTGAGEFVANHELRAEALLVQAGIGAAQYREVARLRGYRGVIADWQICASRNHR